MNALAATDQHTSIAELLGLLDRRINRQVNAILHHPRFQQLESAWRGLTQVVEAAGNDRRVKVKMLNLSARELSKDILNATEFDHSQLFKKIYTAEFDQPGGEPYGLLIGDYTFSHKPNPAFKDTVGVLAGISKIAAAAFSPFVAAAAPELFGIDQFSEFPVPFKVDDLFRQQEYQRFKSLRADEDARFIGLVLPRTLMRLPYNPNGVKVNNRFFKESACRHNDYLWGNACYTFACVAIRCFKESGWFANIRGTTQDIDSGGSITLVRQYYHTDAPGIAAKFSTEFYLTDHQEKILSDAGFIALRDDPKVERGIFYSCPSIQVPSQYKTKVATTNAKISGMLHYVLCASRFAHYVKVIMRDKVGSFLSPLDCENFLYNWLNQYTTSSTGLASNAQARYPLNSVQVKVAELPGSPGQYTCNLHIKPHYQLDDINTHLKLVTNIQMNQGS